jgi:serine/threonine protein kinase
MTTAGATPTIAPRKQAATSENCLPTGTRLADFEIIDVLGEGGFGIVYLAFDHALRRTVAIKEFMPSVLAMRGRNGAVKLRAERHRDTFHSGRKSFINEARLLAQFDHPALVKVHRYWEQNNTAYTAMQYYEGRTIKDIVANSPEQVDQLWCVKMLGQVLQALEVLYTMQVVHRDVSPDNIIVMETGESVLLDFGSAREIIGDMTRAVTVILKPGYAPVEQYTNDTSLEQGAYTDIYALCAVIYFAITGKPPASSIARMVHDPVVPLVTLAPKGFNYAFLAAIDQGLAVLAENRPRTIPVFRTLLGINAVKPLPARVTAPVKRPVQEAAPVPAAAPTPVAAAPAPAPVAAPRLVVVAPAAAPVPEPVVVAAPVAAAVLPASGGASKPASWPIIEDPQNDPVDGKSLKRARWIATIGMVAVAGAVALSAQLRAGPDLAATPLMPAAAEPRRTVVSAKDIEGVEEVVTPDALAALVAAAPVEQTSAAEAMPAASAPVEAPANATVSVALAVKPWGTIFVDGRERGVSPPMKRIVLPAGTHEIRIVNPAYPPYTTTLTVKKNEPATLTHHFGAAPP